MGIKLFDWDGSTQIYDFDFLENGIGVDDRLVSGAMGRGIAALGPNLIAVGLHTGTIVVLEIVTDVQSFVCRLIDSQRSHLNPIADLASTSIDRGGHQHKDVLVSGDETGILNLWKLGKNVGDGIVHEKKLSSFADSPITAITLWNRIGQGIDGVPAAVGR